MLCIPKKSSGIGEPKTSIGIYFRYVNNARKIPKHVYNSWYFNFSHFEYKVLQCNKGNSQRPLNVRYVLSNYLLVVDN